MALLVPPAHGYAVAEAVPDGRRGKVRIAYATTAFVDWADGTASRVPYTSLVKVGKGRKPAKPTVRPRPLTSLERRFAQVVRERMAALGLTFTELSEATGISRALLLRLDEKDGEDSRGFTAQTIERLCLALEVEPNAFWELKPAAR